MVKKEDIVSYFKELQDTICQGLEQADGKAKFSEDKWERSGGGGGRSRIIQNGNVIEKGGVNFSEVFGVAPDFLSKELSSDNAPSQPSSFHATGVSIVIHPQNPMVPIIHMNVRYLEIAPLFVRQDGRTPASSGGESGGSRETDGERWFGGGIDLTPIYVNEEDAVYFHQALKSTCDKFHSSFYPEFKKWADDYFFIKHRNETRGIGGIFFDHLSPLTCPPLEGDKGGGFHLDTIFEFVQAIGNIFLPIYIHLIEKNKNIPFGEKEKNWQLLRRGRYAEFNLVYDRGTKFGLETGGRSESILMSLPPEVKWVYNFMPEKNSPEEKTISLLTKGNEWARK